MGYSAKHRLGEEAVDGGLELDERGKAPRFKRRRESLAKKPSTALSHEHEVGVKWNTQRSCRSSHLRTFGCLWAA